MDEQRCMLAYLYPRQGVIAGGRWDAGRITPAGSFTIDASGRVATTAAGLGTRGVRTSIPMRSGSVYVEARPTHAAQTNSRIAVVCDRYILNSGDTIGLSAPAIIIQQSTGTVWFNGTAVGVLGAIASTSRVCFWLDFDNAIARVRLNNGGWLTVTTDLKVANGWYVAAIENGNSPVRGWQIYTGQAGNAAYANPVPIGASGYTAAAWLPVEAVTSSHAFPAGVDDKGFLFPGRIAKGRDVIVSRLATCWPWGGRTQADRGQIVLANPDGALDHLRDYAWRGAEYLILQGTPTTANVSGYTEFARGLIDKVEFDDKFVILTLADPLALADVAFQKRDFPDDWPNVQARGRPLPVAFGQPRFCAGTLYTTAEIGGNAFSYVFHDASVGMEPPSVAGQLSGITMAYDMGDPFDPPPTDWSYWPGAPMPRLGFSLVNKPAGKVCADIQAPWVGGGVIEDITQIVLAVWERATGTDDFETAPDELYLEAIRRDTGYRLAAHITEPTTGVDVLSEIMGSFTGWLVSNRAGKLIPGRLIDPATESFMAARLGRHNVTGTIRVRDDAATGLTTGMVGDKNHSVHTDADIVTSVPTERREELRSQWLLSHRWAGDLHPDYAHAYSAPPQPTWINRAADLEAEITRICRLYAVKRQFVELSAILTDAQAAMIEPGQVVELTWPRFGMTGKKLLVVGVRSRFYSNQVDLTLWG